MTNLKCFRCGALNVGSAQICKVCQIELNPVRVWLPRSTVHHPTAAWEHGGIKSSPIISIRPFYSPGDVLGPAFRLFFRNFWLITKLTFVIVTPFEIFKAFSVTNLQDDWQLVIGTFVLDLMCKVLIAPALIYALMQVMETGTAPGINESYSWGFSKLGKVIACAALAQILEGLGLALCIVPGIIIGLALELVLPLAILENGSPTRILRRSAELTRGHRANIFGATLVMWVLLMVISVPAGVLNFMQAFGGGFVPLQVGAAIFVDIFEQASTVLSLVIYLSIRALWSQGSQ